MIQSIVVIGLQVRRLQARRVALAPIATRTRAATRTAGAAGGATRRAATRCVRGAARCSRDRARRRDRRRAPAHVPAERAIAEQFARAWERGDYGRDVRADRGRRRAARHAARSSPPPTAGRRRDRDGRRASRAGKVRDRDGGVVALPVDRPHARVRARCTASLQLPVQRRRRRRARRLAPSLVFPGPARPASSLTRSTRLPPARRLLARDGTPLARAPSAPSPLPERRSAIAGELGPPARASAGALRRARLPARRAGRHLRARARVRRAARGHARRRPARRAAASLAHAHAEGGRHVRTTIDPKRRRRRPSTALAGRSAASRRSDPRTGEILALAGHRLHGLQPPGSTFKIITPTGVLEAARRQARRRFPVADRERRSRACALENANGESCGGTLAQSFAHSCNSVFAPLGAKIGGREARRHGRALRLQRAARRSPARREHDPAGRRDRRRPRRRLDRDRPGPRAGDARWRWPSWRRRSRNARPAPAAARRPRAPARATPA